MRKYSGLIFVSMMSLFLTSCHQEEIPTQSLGTTSYYPEFLFWDADTVSLTKTLELEFSKDAKDAGTHAELTFVDNDYNPIPSDELEIKVNGIVAKNNQIKIDATQTECELTFTFLPKAESGKHQGNLRLTSSTLDRVDNQIVEGNQPIDVFKWTIYYEKNTNPLLLGILWALSIIGFALFIWFAFLQPTHFKRFRKSVLVAKNGQNIDQFNCDFTGCRKVVFAKQKVKQSMCDRIFNGEIKTIVKPHFEQPIVFVARRTGRSRVAWASGNGYMVQSNPIPQSGVTIITQPQDKLKITLTT